MKKKMYYTTLFLSMFLSVSVFAKLDKAGGTGLEQKLQSCMFHKFSCQKAIDKTHESGLKYAEIYYDQSPGKDIGGGKNLRINKATQKKTPVFAKSKGAEFITCEPDRWQCIDHFSIITDTLF